ncbi:hypothetical protein Tco_0321253 [Tanacetum coccineum]
MDVLENHIVHTSEQIVCDFPRMVEMCLCDVDHMDIMMVVHLLGFVVHFFYLCLQAVEGQMVDCTYHVYVPLDVIYCNVSLLAPHLVIVFGSSSDATTYSNERPKGNSFCTCQSYKRMLSGDVVLQESYNPKTRGKLYYACPRSKPRQNTFGCESFLWKEERVRLLVGSPRASTTPIYSSGSSLTPIYSPGYLTPPRYSPGASTPQSYSPGSSRNAECSNCKHLLDKITVLEATIEMYMHPE